ncbi:DUF971 domain-containing protein [Botrimarina hoheduenensis]|uniref:Gamma-butyrobetaine hydroxylase-like N-terminal domain-containing protein n=1 Tax=Botrimarina hoheduenensis TaxID=2528000 RepID=A0A5C5VWQ9_9BACT|nr:DUF971 domain-containing protein [Botrimarina hoheduenensis]TWT42455.1 hypothetical protein Pla111_27600 [Botrimarina hoheduenensis]
MNPKPSPATPVPVELSRPDEARVRIVWSDGEQRVYRAAELREACPCATCREKRSAPPPPANQLTVLSAAEARPLSVAGMSPVGAYAYRIDFSDGHNTGLFNFNLLKSLGEAEA